MIIERPSGPPRDNKCSLHQSRMGLKGLQPALVAATGTLLPLSTAALILRFAARTIQGFPLWWDDFFAFVVWVSSLVFLPLCQDPWQRVADPRPMQLFNVGWAVCVGLCKSYGLVEANISSLALANLDHCDENDTKLLS